MVGSGPRSRGAGAGSRPSSASDSRREGVLGAEPGSVVTSAAAEAAAHGVGGRRARQRRPARRQTQSPAPASATRGGLGVRLRQRSRARRRPRAPARATGAASGSAAATGSGSATTTASSAVEPAPPRPRLRRLGALGGGLGPHLDGRVSSVATEATGSSATAVEQRLGRGSRLTPAALASGPGTAPSFPSDQVNGSNAALGDEVPPEGTSDQSDARAGSETIREDRAVEDRTTVRSLRCGAGLGRRSSAVCPLRPGESSTGFPTAKSRPVPELPD